MTDSRFIFYSDLNLGQYHCFYSRPYLVSNRKRSNQKENLKKNGTAITYCSQIGGRSGLTLGALYQRCGLDDPKAVISQKCDSDEFN